MTIPEFSSTFDTLLNSYAHKAMFGELTSQIDVSLDEFEKSVFLTSALEDIVKELYSGKYSGEGFEYSEKLRRELESLVSHKEYSTAIEDTEKLPDNKYNHTVFELPDTLLYIIYELVLFNVENNTCLNGLVVDVYPTTHDEYIRTRNNPFRGPNNRRVLRLDKGDSKVELISKQPIGKYIIRYVRYPLPIILADLTSTELNIHAQQKATPCELPDILHKEILERAVRLALVSKGINLRNNNSEL